MIAENNLNLILEYSIRVLKANNGLEAIDMY